MSKLFQSVEMRAPGRSRFDLTHDVKMSTNMGRLTPTLVMELVPGDHVTLGCDTLVRLAPMVAPMMHRCDVKTEYFFVPSRICWDHWEDFITGGDDGTLTPAVPFVTLNPATYGPGTLPDYMGIGFGDAGSPANEKVLALPFMAFQLVWQEYYRDENLQDPLPFKTLVDGDNAAHIADLLAIRNRAWEHDPFTSALPFAQKGPAVSVPLGDVALKPEWVAGTLPPPSAGDPNPAFRRFGTSSPAQAGNITNAVNGLTALLETHIGSSDSTPAAYDPANTLTVTPTTINDLRTAYQLQRFLERQARGGTRYTEVIRAHFGVRSKDSRLQRPEYIVGTKTPIVISEVLNMTGTADAPQGNMAGHGVAVNAGKYGSYFATEHGYIIGVVSIMPKTAYQEGVPRMWKKFTDKYDFFWPEFAHLGEQEVLLSELYGGATNNSITFGYLPRYWEYKSMPNRVAGDFKTTLDFWHMGRIFGGTAPVLNEDFVVSDPTTRVFAVDEPTVDHVWMQQVHKILATRPMPYFGTPGW